nr:MAG TPA: TRAF PROTEIN, TRAO PROTEIN, TRAN ADHESION, BACTERIAL SECRETION.5A [Caudoviricetes sp.]
MQQFPSSFLRVRNLKLMLLPFLLLLASCSSQSEILIPS